MVKVMSLLARAGSGLRFSFGVRAWTKMRVEGMHRLKLVSSKNTSVVKGLKPSRIEMIPQNININLWIVSMYEIQYS